MVSEAKSLKRNTLAVCQGPTHLQQLLDAPVAQQQLAHEQQLDPSAPHHQQAVPQVCPAAPLVLVPTV